jgi:hypothetical protein
MDQITKKYFGYIKTLKTELVIIIRMYLMENNLKYIYLFILLFLLGSCRKNNETSEFTVDPPYQYKVEYMKDTIRITDLLTIKSKGVDEYPIIWVKKNGMYYYYNFLMMSTRGDTSYVVPTGEMVRSMKEMRVIRKIGKNLYSNKVYWEFSPHHWELSSAIIYDKSYRIIKFQYMLECNFILKK